MKKYILISSIFILVLLSSGCNLQPSTPQFPADQQSPAPVGDFEPGTVTFLVPTEDPLTFCNGADMDSDGFQKTITKEVTKNLAVSDLSQTAIITRAIVLASQEANLTDVTNSETDFIKIKDDTAYIKPIDGWAGVSIFLCAWKSLVETNLLYLANITNVVWLTDMQQWENIK